MEDDREGGRPKGWMDGHCEPWMAVIGNGFGLLRYVLLDSRGFLGLLGRCCLGRLFMKEGFYALDSKLNSLKSCYVHAQSQISEPEASRIFQSQPSFPPMLHTSILPMQ